MVALWKRSLVRALNLPLAWSSRLFRVALVIAGLYALCRLVIHLLLMAGLVAPDVPILSDLHIYLDAAARLRAQEELYCVADPECLANPEMVWSVYPYSPAFALALAPLLALPAGLLAAGSTLLHVVVYALLYAGWWRIFTRTGLERARQTLAYTLPLWLLFSAFWSDLGYGNIYVAMALLATLLIEAVLEERLGWATLWLVLILALKPHWAFAAAVPLLLGRYRFFLKLVGLTVLGYVALAGLTILAVGPDYGLNQYANYYRFLAWLPSHYAWRLAPDALGYNHSLRALLHYALGADVQATRTALAARVVVLLPLLMVTARRLTHPTRKPGRETSALTLDLAFALYAGAWLWLDVVWEWSLAVAVFAYLLSTLETRGERGLAWAAFLPYALLDVWRLAAFALLGDSTLLRQRFFLILADVSVYVPLVLLLLLTFYGLLVRRLWQRE